MFSVLFEVQPRKDQWDAYLGYAKTLRPELEGIDGFVDNIRYRSLTREGWILSLSSWRDEKAVVRWRTRAKHHEVQELGRQSVLLDYHLRVGQITGDSQLPEGCELEEQRLDETEVGEGTAISLSDVRLPEEHVKETAPKTLAERLGLREGASGLVSWDIYDAVLSPGSVILFCTWRDAASAAASEENPAGEGARRRRVRVIRDYAMRDRREAPQYYPEVGEPK